MLRELIAKFNRSMAERVVAIRYKRAVPIKISFEPNGNTERMDAPPKIIYIMGETVDMSYTGIAFVVASIRVKEDYLVGAGRRLNAEIDLPSGKISMKVVGRRYERMDDQISAARYLIGASIEEITDEDREAYDGFLHYGSKNGNTGSLKFGIDES